MSFILLLFIPLFILAIMVPAILLRKHKVLMVLVMVFGLAMIMVFLMLLTASITYNM